MQGDRKAGHVPRRKGQQCKCHLFSHPHLPMSWPVPTATWRKTWNSRANGDSSSWRRSSVMWIPSCHLNPGERIPDPRRPMAAEVASGDGAAPCSAPEPGGSEPSRPRAAFPGPMGLRRIVVLLSTVSLWCQRDRHGVVVLDAEHVVTQAGKSV